MGAVFVNYNMRLDARGLESTQLFIKLKDMLNLYCVNDVPVEIILDSRSRTGKAKAFASMSGCQTEIEERDGNYILKITGGCRCGG